MALTPEDGTGLSNADSYCTIAFADDYLAARGFSLWATMSDTEKEQAIRRATDYMTQAYGTRWAGTRLTATQALDWPRYSVPDSANGYYSSTVVPALVVKACVVLSFKAAAGDLSPDIKPLATRVKIGPIEKEYAAGSSQIVRFRAIDDLLAPLLSSGGAGMIRVIRA